MVTDTGAMLIDSFDKMSMALLEFNDHLQHCDLPLWLPLKDTIGGSEKMKSKAIDLFSNFWYTDDQDGRLTVNCHGVIGASDALIASALNVNATKDLFKQAVSHLKNKNPKAINSTLQSRSQHLAAVMKRDGLSRLHLKQCYRHIPVLSKGCSKVNFSWYSSGRSIKCISQQQSLKMLLALDQSSAHIQAQIERLSKLRPDTRLAQVQTQVPIMRANAVWPVCTGDYTATDGQKLTNMQWLRKARNVPLPLLIPMVTGDALPVFSQPSLTPPKKRSRAIRSDILIDDTPLLPSLRIHCYKQRSLHCG